jgi:hypothetical protein
MNIFGRLFKTFAPRIIGAAVSGLTGWLYAKTQGAVVVDPDMAAKMITGMIVTYAGAHRLASAVINPGDAATARVAVAIHDAADDATSVVIPPSTK